MARTGKVGALRVDIEANEADLVRSLAKADKALKKQRTQLKKQKQSYDRLGKAASGASGKIKGLVAGLAAGLGLAFIKSLADANTELLRVAERSEISFEALQKLNKVFMNAGGASEDFTDALNELNQKIDEASIGNATAAEAFAALGLDDVGLKALDTEERFLTVVDALGKLTDETERARVANDIFGGEVGKFVQNLSVQEGGIRGLAEEAASFGTISQEAAENSREFTTALGNLGSAAATALANFFFDNTIIDSITDSIGWLAEQFGVLAENLQQVTDEMEELNAVGGEAVNTALVLADQRVVEAKLAAQEKRKEVEDLEESARLSGVTPIQLGDRRNELAALEQIVDEEEAALQRLLRIQVTREEALNRLNNPLPPSEGAFHLGDITVTGDDGKPPKKTKPEDFGYPTKESFERYNEAIARINEGGIYSYLGDPQVRFAQSDRLDEIRDVGHISGDFSAEVDQTLRDIEEMYKETEMAAQAWEDTVSRAFTDADNSVQTFIEKAINGFDSFEDALKSLTASLVSDFAPVFTKFAIGQLFGPSAAAGTGGIFSTLFGSFQHGGLASGLSLVGEAGPELVDFRSPGRVYSNEMLGAALSGRGGETFNFNPTIIGSDEIKVRQVLNEQMPVFIQRARASIVQDQSRRSYFQKG